MKVAFDAYSSRQELWTEVVDGGQDAGEHEGLDDGYEQ